MARKQEKIYQYAQISSDIHVSVIPFYIEGESLPEDRHYVWGYQVRIENLGKKTVRLQKRTWIITDENGGMEIVQGEGVVGEQPELKSGDGYEYTSFISLNTPSGMMRGSYEMLDESSREAFNISIPLFSLDIPGINRTCH